jgi:spore germination protein YaaH/flagellar hook assembly protein FlgD
VDAVRRRGRSALAIGAVLTAQLLLVAPVSVRANAATPPANVASAVGAPPLAPLPASARSVPGRAPRAEADSTAPARVLPSVHFEDAAAHEGDDIEFEPGGRVTVPFRPRANDTFEVGGVRPRPLPAGRATGRDMAAAAQGSRWATLGAGAPGPASPPEPAPTPAPADPPRSAQPSPQPSSEPSPEPSSGPVVNPSNVPPSHSPSSPAPDDAPVDAPAAGPGDLQSAVGASAVVPAADEPPAPAATGLLREVFGFLPYWELADSSTVLDYSVLSTVAYFSVGTDRYGNLLKKNSDGTTTTGWGGWTSSRLTNVINAAHAKGTRVVLTITCFAWTTSQKSLQGALLGSPTARLNLARQAAAAVRDRGADGINLDFEPIASTYGDEFALFVREVRAELDKIAPGYQLTFDTTGFIGNYPIEAATAPGGADAIFVMGYDYKTAGAAVSGSIDPLVGASYDLTDTIKAYTARVPASKLILGVPYYGRAWSTETDAAHAKNISGTKYGTSTTVVYTSVLPYVTQHGRRWDSLEQSPYVVYRRENCTTTYGCVTAWRQIWYDDATSLKLRYDLVNQKGLRGAGIWALGYDNGRTELNRALAERFSTDATPPVAGIRVLPTRARDAGFVVSWTGTDASGIAGWDVQVSVDGGPFVAWLADTRATSEVYLAEDGHGYAFRVRARDVRGNTGSWDVTSVWKATPTLAPGGFAAVRIDGLAMRSAATTSSTKLGELDAGNILAVVSGPVHADGYAWWQATGPLREWGAVTATQTFWVAQDSDSETFVSPYRAPNSTTVDAVLRAFVVGDPSMAAAGAGRVVSPNGDGRHDTISIGWTNDVALDSLELRVLRSDGVLAGTIPLSGLGPGDHEVAWDGRAGGAVVADGTYILALVGVADGVTYSAPSSRPVTPSQLAAFGVKVDTIGPAIASPSITATAFSPNGDERKDTVRASIQPSEVAEWGASVAAATDGTAAVRTAAGAGSTVAWTWDGRSDTTVAVPDGPYRLSLWVADAAGNRTFRSWDVTVDTRPAEIAGSATPAAFSPNGDKLVDTSRLTWSADEPATGSARIVKGSTVIRSWTARQADGITWTGADARGSLVPDGRYALRVELTDGAGNVTVRDIAVGVDRTVRNLTWTAGLFYPQDGDSIAASAVASFSLIRPATASLRIYAADGTYVKTAWRDRALPAGTHRWTWNGRSGSGAFVPRGWYRAELVTTSWVGTTTTTRTVLADAYRVSASPISPAAGQTVTISLRTAEALVAAPRVTFTQAGLAGVAKTATSLGGGRYSVTFRVAAGAAGRATIRITGRDRARRPHTQTAAITVR